MGAGKDCIAPQMGIFEELLGEEGGVLYEPGSVEGLGKALRSAAGHPEDLKRMGERNRRVASAWTAEAVGAATSDLIRKAIEVRRVKG